MKYQGVKEIVGLSVREYLGVRDGTDAWVHIKYAIGVIVDNAVYDYRSGQQYDFIGRDKDGSLNTYRSNIKIGNVYAVQDNVIRLSDSKKYSDYDIERIIRNSGFFGEEYIKKDKAKVLQKNK